METEKLIDYEQASKQLEEAQNRPEFWNPNPGKYEVVCLSEMSVYRYPNKKDPNIMEERAKVTIEVEQKQYTWSFGIGITKASLYGQLVDFATKNDNKLIGSKFTLVVKSDGKKRDFTIV